jgi:hypothetical protein
MIPDETVARAREMSIVAVARSLGAARGVEVPERGVPCPGCGGKDRFSVDPAKNVFLCRASGQGGDPIDLVRHVHSLDFSGAVEMLTGEIRAGKAVTQTADQSDAYRMKARKRAYEIWRNARAPREMVERYFRARGLPIPTWPLRSIRETPRLDYWHWHSEAREFRKVHEGPAMLAAIMGPDGHFIGLHRTWLDVARPKGKAEIFDPETGEQLDVKKVMGSQRGGRIVLRDDGETRSLDIGEGIETLIGFDAMQGEPGRALWCAVNLDNLAGKAAGQIPHPTRKLINKLGQVRAARVGGPEPDLADLSCLHIPARFIDVRIAGDSDGDRFGTMAAVTRAAARMAMPGRMVTPAWAPDGLDWDDVASSASRAASAPAGRAIRPDGQSALRTSSEVAA